MAKYRVECENCGRELRVDEPDIHKAAVAIEKSGWVYLTDGWHCNWQQCSNQYATNGCAVMD